jgi:DNA topoisomerase-2
MVLSDYCDKTNTFATTLKCPGDKSYDWELVVVVANDVKKFSVSFVNGIHTMDGGNHVKYVLNALAAGLAPGLSKTFKRSITAREISKNIAIFLVTTITDPSYKSQSKVELDKPNKFEHEIPANFIQKMKKPMTEIFDTKHLETPEKKTRTDFRAIVKFTDALKAGTKDRIKCSLFIPEGDSAEQFVNIGIRNKETNLGVHYYGVFNIQGKPLNARKQVSYRQTKGGDKMTIKTQTLKDNERLNSLIKVIGLDEKKTYDLTKEGDEEFAKLRYGSVIVAVDQDVDGVGHIFGLILNLFDLFWPNLIKRGFIKRFATPLLMAYPHKGKKVLTFYSAAEYNKWKDEKFSGKEPTTYNIQYFKGLAGHENKTIISFFKRFDERIYCYNLDQKSSDLFETYFGKDTAARKTELRSPIVPYIPVQNKIFCSQQLQCETKEYQLADITRSLPHIMDGQRPASRIAIEGARRYFTGKREKAKVSNLASTIAGELCYEHGPSSLEETIKKMNQAFPGACNLPLFIARSQFGSRDDGGKATAASRYIFTELNRALTDYLFPVEDDPLLPRRSEDGKLCEPKYYVPIVPLSILENFKIPGTGWQANIQARDFDSVVENVKILIESCCDDLTQQKANKIINYMPYWNLHSKCTMTEKGRKLLLRGQYSVKGNIVKITDLPPGIWPKTWKESMFDKMTKKDKYKIITNVINTSTDFDINIDVEFTDAEEIKKIDKEYECEDVTGIEKFLEIYLRESSTLSFVGVDDLIYEARGYDEILYQWFVTRKDLYVRRIKRELIILRWKIKILENIIQYVEKCSAYKITDKSLESMTKLLTGEKYQMINSGHLNNCDECPTEELETYFMQNANYNYLIDLRERDKLKESNEKRIKTKKELEAKIANLSREEFGFLGSHIWMDELEKLQQHVNSCIAARNWAPNDKTFEFE